MCEIGINGGEKYNLTQFMSGHGYPMLAMCGGNKFPDKCNEMCDDAECWNVIHRNDSYRLERIIRN